MSDREFLEPRPYAERRLKRIAKEHLNRGCLSLIARAGQIIHADNAEEADSDDHQDINTNRQQSAHARPHG
ncbi:hypothetical protein D3C84_865960 [compost metagenome]